MPGYDLLVAGGTLLTMDPERRVVAGGGLAIKDGLIAAVLEPAELTSADASRTIDARGKAVLPGFVNTHAHGCHNLLRGGPSDDRGLYDWIVNVLNPGMAVFTKDDAEAAAELYALETVHSGITTVVDTEDYARLPFLTEATIDVYRRRGLRAIFARMFYDMLPPPGSDMANYLEVIELKEPEVVHDDGYVEDTATALADIEALIERYHGAEGGRIHVWPAPAIPMLNTRESFLGAKEIARRHGTGVTIHLAESSLDRMHMGMTGVQYLDAIGFLGPEVLAAHVVHADLNDIRLMRRHDVKVAHNPVANMFLADGIAPVGEMLLAGMTVGLGTDDCNDNQSVSMLADLKFAALATKVRYHDPAAMTAEKVLEMATIDGARACGLDHQIGSLEPGKRADAIVIGLSHPQTTPCHNVPSALVYQAYGHEVETVMVDGQLLKEEGRLTRISEEEQRDILSRAQSASDGVVARAGLTKLANRPWTSIP
jgi:cytosine/adenosine deaminase-related metal-dependent hydrolase